MTLAPGQTLSCYEVLGPLGAGGMGEVYRARDTRLRREVALKVLPEEMEADEERVHRFEREARALASLSHPNVAQIYGFDRVGSTCFMAMELVPGKDLAARLRRGPLPVAEALEVCRQIAEGVEAAHEAGVIHRDLKPANVILTPEGRVKVLDFGLAKAVRSAVVEGTEARRTLSTEPGLLMGTPTYMAPEHALGRPCDRRADVWAFGCVLYECLTGRRAFGGEQRGDVLLAVVESQPDWSALPAGTPARVRRLLARCLDKDPRTRLQSMGEARIALAGRTVDEEAPAAVPSARRWLVFLLGGLAIGVVVTALLERRLGPGAPARNPLEDATRTWLTDFGGTAFGASISPDGKWVSFVSDHLGELDPSVREPFDLYTCQVTKGDFKNRTNGSNRLWLDSLRDTGFTADSSEVWLAGGRGRQMKSMPLQGGEFRSLLPAKAVNADWSRDGSRIVYETLDPGDPVYVTSSKHDPGELVHGGDGPGFHNHFPTWSFDDGHIFLARGRQDTGDMNLWWMRPDGADLVQLTRNLRNVRSPAPIDARTVLFVADDRTGAGSALYVLDLETHDLQIGSSSLEQVTSVSASRDGSRLVVTVSKPRAHLWTLPIPAELETFTELTEADVRPLAGMSSQRALAPRFSGKDLYYLSSRGTGDGLWRMHEGKSEEVWPGAERGLLWPPSISSDGRYVALVLPDGSRMGLSVLDTEGGGTLRPLAPGIDVRGTSSWSPDDRWIVVCGTDANGKGLFRVPAQADGGEVKALVRGESLDPLWSPRDDMIVYCGKQVTGTMPLRAVDPSGNPVELLDIEVTRGSERYRFLPDGSGLVYMQGLNFVQDFYLYDFETKQTRRLAHLGGSATMRTFDVSPDGKTLVFDRVERHSDIALIELEKRS